MPSFIDNILVGLGIVGLLLTAVAVNGRRPLSETLPIGVGALGLALVGLGGLVNLLLVSLAGAALVAGSIGLDWYWRLTARR